MAIAHKKLTFPRIQGLGNRFTQPCMTRAPLEHSLGALCIGVAEQNKAGVPPQRSTNDRKIKAFSPVDAASDQRRFLVVQVSDFCRVAVGCLSDMRRAKTSIPIGIRRTGLTANASVTPKGTCWRTAGHLRPDCLDDDALELAA